MRLRSRFSGAMTLTMAVALTSAAWSAPAHAEEVRTLTGPATSNADLYMTYVNCDNFFGPAAAPQSRLNLGPFNAPMGRRSLGLVPSAPGTATGPFARFDSLAAVDSTLSAAGSSGVSYIWTVNAESAPGTAWSGRAVINPAGGAWTPVNAASLSYDWTLVNLSTHAPVAAGGQATPGEFAATHGDGSGFVVTGFGCDGQSFNIDAMSSGGVTYDFEGISLQTGIAKTTEQVREDGTIEITGTVRDGSGRITGDPLVLESRKPGGEWAAVGGPSFADATGVARTVAPVTETTEFRWHRPESQYADEGWSEPVTVTVTPAPEAEPSTKPQEKADEKSDAKADPQQDATSEGGSKK